MITETTMTFYLPSDLKNQIKNTAHDERLVMSAFMRKVLCEYIESKKEAQ